MRTVPDSMSSVNFNGCEVNGPDDRGLTPTFSFLPFSAFRVSGVTDAMRLKAYPGSSTGHPLVFADDARIRPIL